MILADMTDEDGALAEMDDLDSLNLWLSGFDQSTRTAGRTFTYWRIFPRQGFAGKIAATLQRGRERAECNSLGEILHAR